jgi:hypothetical protein
MARQSHKGGFVVTVELLFIVTLLVIGVAIAFPLIRNAVIAELEDSSEAIGALDQTYWISGADIIGIAISETVGSHEGASLADSIDAVGGAGDDSLSYDLLILPDFSEAGGISGGELSVFQGL